MNIIEKIRLLLKLQKSIKEVKEMELKAGWKTTEFWLTVLTNLGSVAGALNGIIDPKTAGTIITVINSVYTILRTLAKKPEITTIVDASTVNAAPK